MLAVFNSISSWSFEAADVIKHRADSVIEIVGSLSVGYDDEWIIIMLSLNLHLNCYAYNIIVIITV